jgi:phosphoserine aminotransferase
VQNQTYNTPAVATLVLLDAQVRWMLDNGGMAFTSQRSATSAATLYGWAEARAWATPFVGDPAKRSTVVGTIDLDDSISADDVCTALRANGVLDTFAYRKLGRNQLRIGMFPAIDPSDIEALTACIDHVVDALA